MVYKNNIPQPNDFLSVSQVDILANFGTLDTTFEVDHYTFSNTTAEAGKHNRVTTPGFISDPPTVPVAPPVTTTDPVFYGFEPLDAGGVPTTSLGLLQYSRGPSNAVPTPVTHLQSPSTPIIMGTGTNSNVLDFTGIARAFCMFYAADVNATTQRLVCFVIWNGTAFTISNIVSGISAFFLTSTGNILHLRNTGVALNNVYWTLDLLRVQ